MRHIRATAFILTYATTVLCATAAADNLIYKDQDGLIRITPYPVSAEYHNTPWTKEQETEFVRRYNDVIQKHLAAGATKFGGTWFEDEKRSYPNAMTTYVAGIATGHARLIDAARAHLQGNDVGPDTGYTKGVDLYASFTLKGQVPKYFYFGRYGNERGTTPDNYLSKGYLDDTMIEAIKIWLGEGDPLTARHPKYPDGPTDRGKGYAPQHTGARVDTRGTDNLKAMREIAVYLFANEAAKHEPDAEKRRHFEQIRYAYAKHYADGAVALARTGISEWDSPNYMSWSIGPHLSMFDFAPEDTPHGRAAKRQAKATLDLTLAPAALKYFRGGYGGPGLRDYGGTSVPMGNDTAKALRLYFGQNVVPDESPIIQNDLHIMLSSYRPPQAILDLARRNFAKPVEILSTKPPYANWKTPEPAAPRYFETDFYADHYQFGTIVSPDKPGDHQSGPWEPNVFKIASFSSARGADYFGANTAPLDGHGKKNLGDQIAHYRNLAIWLRPADGKTFYFMAPDPTKARGGQGAVEVDSGIHFYRMEKNWIALRPINLTPGGKSNGSGRNADEMQYEFTAATNDGSYTGFAVEIGELGTGAAQFPNYETFKNRVKTKSSLDLSQLTVGVAALTGNDGATVKIAYNRDNDLPAVYRDSKTRHNSADRNAYALYQSVNHSPLVTLTANEAQHPGTIRLTADASDAGNRGPIAMEWQSGRITILSGTKDSPLWFFEESVTPEGTVAWNERKAVPADYTGRVERVEFYHGQTLLGSDTDAADGWSFDWRGVAAGAYEVRARAIDNDAQSTWSATMTIEVAP